MSETIGVGILGLGVVGSGVIKMIMENKESLYQKTGNHLSIERILVQDKAKERDIEIDSEVLTTDANDVLNHADIDIIIEVIGGVEEAKLHIQQALRNKKHVVTANKDLIALYGPELHQLAKQNGCDLLYEASVGGGIPIIRGLNDGLAADEIKEIMGIINGTTNYILTKMEESAVPFKEALADAQELGFAEADPTADIEGLDAARKMSILSRIAFSTNVKLSDIETNGINNLSLVDLEYGKQLGYTMKLIGLAKSNNGTIEISVQPTFIAKGHPLAGVKDEYNAVYVRGKSVGETMFYGPGAGSLPTATAIMSDVIEVAKNIQLGVNGKTIIEGPSKKGMTPPNEQYSQFFLRLHVKDEVGSFAHISQLFQDMDISFKRILQTPMKKQQSAEIILVTHHTSLENFMNAISKLQDMDVLRSIESYYRVEGEVEE
ncbi:homoserine dehydrogenase [Cerasibacillus terrae]|uniref:Homoserine dehydrogenase n=1 Tax=Cerasibacillus terrae TaxID=2498845 RepID=A0A5C8NT13_9BACI|nr:homoserine dehydrogenase [Cerasibacillus terrae]TXL63663.1 homoserine dehydrogenase [Cerasibacillus terrae]